MADDHKQTRFTMADLARLEEKMRTPPPPAMHLRPHGPMRSMGDALGREAQTRQRDLVARHVERPVPIERRDQGTRADFRRSAFEHDR